MHTVQFQNSNAQQSTKSITQLTSTVEKRCPKRILLPVVKDGQVVDGTREEDRLGNAHEEAGGHEGTEACCCARCGGDGAPKDHGAGDV